MLLLQVACGQNYTVAITEDGSKVFACGASIGGVFGIPNMNKSVTKLMVSNLVYNDRLLMCVCMCVCVYSISPILILLVRFLKPFVENL